MTRVYLQRGIEKVVSEENAISDLSKLSDLNKGLPQSRPDVRASDRSGFSKALEKPAPNRSGFSKALEKPAPGEFSFGELVGREFELVEVDSDKQMAITKLYVTIVRSCQGLL